MSYFPLEDFHRQCRKNIYETTQLFFEHAHTFTDMSLEDFHRQCKKNTYNTTQFFAHTQASNTAITMKNYLVKTLHEI